jgi:hypothetical protein
MKTKGFVTTLLLLLSSCVFASSSVPAENPVVQSLADTVVARGLEIYGLTFQKNSSVIPAEAYGNLDELTDLIGKYLDRQEIPAIQITGFTDSFGSAEHNLKLSRERAEAVMKYIFGKYADKGLKTGDFTVRGLGAAEFIADNATEEGRSRNRRIELVITGKTSQKKVIIGEIQKIEEVKKPDLKPAEIKQTQKPEENGMCWKCAGLGVLDIGLVAYAIYAVSDEWNAADNYNKKYNVLDKPQGSNYDQLSSMKKTVDDKKTLVVAGACLAGAAIAYTAADYFWMHNIFHAEVNVGLKLSDSAINGVIITAKKEF